MKLIKLYIQIWLYLSSHCLIKIERRTQIAQPNIHTGQLATLTWQEWKPAPTSSQPQTIQHQRTADGQISFSVVCLFQDYLSKWASGWKENKYKTTLLQVILKVVWFGFNHFSRSLFVSFSLPRQEKVWWVETVGGDRNTKLQRGDVIMWWPQLFFLLTVSFVATGKQNVFTSRKSLPFWVQIYLLVSFPLWHLG